MPDAAYVHDAPFNALSASSLMRTLMDEAREIAALRRLAGSRDHGNLAWLSPADVSGVHVFQEADGWAADLTLENQPPGRPACIGAKAPLRDRQAAVTFATSLLSDVVLAHSLEARLPNALWPFARTPEAFAYDGQAIPLPAETLDVLRACGADRIGLSYAHRRLEEVRKDLLGGADLTAERLEAMAPGETRPFVAVCALAALKGVTGWHRPAEGAEPPAVAMDGA